MSVMSHTKESQQYLYSSTPPHSPFCPADWDEQRRDYIKKHPGANMTRYGRSRLLLVTGSQPGTCSNAVGDYLLLKSLKNKMDYCDRHDMEVRGRGTSVMSLGRL